MVRACATATSGQIPHAVEMGCCLPQRSKISRARTGTRIQSARGFIRAACTARLVGVRIEGPYEVGGPAPGLEDTFQARFGFAKKTITPYVDGLVGALAAMGCGSSAWQLGQPQDVLEAGCAAFGQYPASRCAADYDLVKLDAEGLHFGARPADNDMCTPEKRPTRLNPSVFQRR